jgi:hypothetical protein
MVSHMVVIGVPIPVAPLSDHRDGVDERERSRFIRERWREDTYDNIAKLTRSNLDSPKFYLSLQLET